MAELKLKKKTRTVSINGIKFPVRRSSTDIHSDYLEYQEMSEKLKEIEGTEQAKHLILMSNMLESMIKSAIGDDSLEIISGDGYLDFADLFQIATFIVTEVSDKQTEEIENLIKNYG